MTRQSRTLLILLIMAVGSVVALGMMAQRYSKLLERRASAEAQGIAGDPGADSSADHSVQAYAAVRERLRRALDDQRRAPESSDAATRDALRATLSRALLDYGLERKQFQRLETMCRRWQAGERVAAPFRAAFERHAARLAATDLAPYDPLAL